MRTRLFSIALLCFFSGCGGPLLDCGFPCSSDSDCAEGTCAPWHGRAPICLCLPDGATLDASPEMSTDMTPMNQPDISADALTDANAHD